MTSPPQPYNYSYIAIPLAFGHALLPHTYYLSRLMIATRNAQSNAMPRTNLEAFKNKLPSTLWNHLTRARGAHLNSMEVFPLFAAAMVAGNVAGLTREELNGAATSWFVARTVYMALYMGVKSDVLALARTGVYAWSISIPIVALWKAGKVASGDV